MRFAGGIVAAAFVLLGALAGTAAAQPALPIADSNRHLGVASCMGSNCHGAVEPSKNSPVMQNEYVVWSQKDRHARAYKLLFEDRSVRIAKNLRLDKPAHEAPECLSCHGNLIPQDRRGPQFQISDGVTCEACHGGGSGWLGTHISQTSHEANIKAGMYPTDQPIARAKLCLSCHFGSEQNKFVTHRIMGAGHPRMAFELDTFTAIQPAHYIVDKDYGERKGMPNGVQIWAIGQAMSLQTIMEGYLDPKRNADGIYPELVFFDCHACHHPMSNLRWEARPSSGLPPGVIKFNDANALMLRLAAERVEPGLGKALGDRMLAFHRATLQSRDATQREAVQVRDISKQLVEKFATHNFVRDDIIALARAVVADGLNKRDFVDYAGAEQATMALGSLLTAMRNVGALNEQQATAASQALNKLYAAVEKDEQYRSDTYVVALREFGQSIPGLAQ